MAFADRAANWIIRLRAVSILVTWFHLWGPLTGLAIAIGGGVWAVMIGVATPIVLMAIFCTITASAYLALVPMAYKVLRKVEDMPVRVRPDPEIWRHLERYYLFEAACLLADLEPNLVLAQRGDAYGWYRALVEAVRSQKLTILAFPLDYHSLVSRDDLHKFAGEHGTTRPFLSQGFAP